MKKILSVLIMTVSLSSVHAGWLEDLRDKYLYSDYDIEGVEQSYENAHVYVPGSFFKTIPSKVDVTKKYPVVIYLHGCTGIVQHDYFWAKTISDLGYIVVQPDSLSRPNTKVICDAKSQTSQRGLAAGIALMQRQQEIKYALSQVKQSPWADTTNIFLMGHSQGGVSTALNKNNEFRGLIISGWTCTHSVSGGIKSDKNIPVLAIAFDKDPWYYGKDTQGRCADQAEGRVKFTQLDLSGAHHGTAQEPEAKASVSKFLKENTNETR
jgi:dienelactone hydrolase